MSVGGSRIAKTPETKREGSVSKSRNTEPSQPLSSPIDRILFLQRTIGNQAVQRLFKSGVIQAKLRIGQPNDVYEQEADRVAEMVMQMPENSVVRKEDESVQRKSASPSAKGPLCGEEEIIQPKLIRDEITSTIQRQNQTPQGAERQFWLSLGQQHGYGVLDKGKRTPMAITTGNQEADEILWTLEALINKAEQMRTFLRSRFGKDKELRVTSVVKPGEHTRYRKLDVVPDGSTTWEELAAAAAHAGFWIHAEGVTLYGKYWPLSPKATGPHFDLYLIKREIGDFPLPSTIERPEREEEILQTKEASCHDPEVTPDIESNVNALRSGGEPLPESVCSFYERRFGYDFRRVRIHTDAKAAESARKVNALAYTVENHIVFGSGQYTLQTTVGQGLLAHELTHTVQQNAGKVSCTKIKESSPHSASELEAVAASQAVGRQRWFSIESHGEVQLARQGSPDAGVPEPHRADQVECVKRRGGCPETRPSEEEASKKVCLTFDDGPQKGTEDCLNALGGTIPATFFLTGKNMASDQTTQKALVERMLKEGHQIGNHTFTHDPMTTKGYDKAYGDLSDPAKLKKFQENYEKNEAHFLALLGTTSPVFKLARLPGNGRFVKVGDKLIFVVATEGLGMAHVTWHFEFGTNGSFGHLKVLDWKGIKGVAAEVKRFPNPNDIILLHDRHWSEKQTLLEEVFKTLSANSFTFGKLDATGKCV